MPVSIEEKRARAREYQRRRRANITPEQAAMERERIKMWHRANKKRCAQKKAERENRIREENPLLYKAMRERRNATQRKRRRKAIAEGINLNPYNKMAHRNYHYIRNFGITANDIETIMKHQQFGCPICQRDLRDLPYHQIHFDHDHKEGYARGVLCGRCNQAIGLLGDCPFIVEMAREYLKTSRELRGVSMVLGVFTKQEMARLEELKKLRQEKEQAA